MAVSEYRAPWSEGKERSGGRLGGCPTLFRRVQLEKELLKPVGHLLLNEKGSQELWRAPHPSCPRHLPVTPQLFRTTGQVALNQAIYMLMWQGGLRLKQQESTVFKRKTRKGMNEAEAGQLALPLKILTSLVSSGPVTLLCPPPHAPISRPSPPILSPIQKCP